jgi:glutamyl-tRNA reductase
MRRARRGELICVKGARRRLSTVEPMDALDYELERALRLLKGGREAADVAAELSHRLTNKMLHSPTRALREKACQPCTSTS